MPAQRFNFLIFQKNTRNDKDTSVMLRGCFSSNRKAAETLRVIKAEETERLSHFCDNEPLCSDADGRSTITVTGFQTTLFLLKVPQDVSIANTI